MNTVTQYNHKVNFFQRVWRGEISLPIIFWILGILGEFIGVFLLGWLITAEGTLNTPPDQHKLLSIYYILGLVVFISYQTWVAISIWKSANKYNGFILWKWISKLFVFLTLFCSAFLTLMIFCGIAML